MVLKKAKYFAAAVTVTHRSGYPSKIERTLAEPLCMLPGRTIVYATKRSVHVPTTVQSWSSPIRGTSYRSWGPAARSDEESAGSFAKAFAL